MLLSVYFCTGWFCVSREEATSVEGMPPWDPVVRHFLSIGEGSDQ